MHVEQLEREKSFDRQVVFFPALPAVLRVMTGGDRLSARLGVALERGAELLLNSCSHLPVVCAQLVFSSEGQIVLSDRDKQIHPRPKRYM